MKRFFKNISIALCLTTDLSADEKLKNLTKEQKTENLIRDIEAIRHSGNYIPDYNKPKLYMDYVLIVDFTFEKKSITSTTLIGADRPQDFGNDIQAWFKSIQQDNKNSVEERRILALQKEQRQLVLEEEFAPLIMNRFLKVD